MPYVAYITRKVFADGSDEIRIKQNRKITIDTIRRAQLTKSINKMKREQRKIKLENELLKLTFLPQDARKRRKLENELQLRNLQNIYRSAHRSRNALYDICRCNEFQYFATWTFDPKKVERLNDRIVKRKFTQFQNYLRKKFPQMYYVAVPEYHKDGGLHFHLLIGGVTMDELKAVPARYEKRKGRHKKGDLIFKNGHQIFNVTRWKLGYSTLSVIANGEASKHYICKYISKQHYDDRFFNKRRYYVSKNIKRPTIEKWYTKPEECLQGIDDNIYIVDYLDLSNRYVVLSSDGNGIVNTEMNMPEVKKHLSNMCRPTARAGKACAAAPSGGACPYLTIRTLDRKIDWEKEKRRLKRAIAKTKREFKPPHEDYRPLLWEEQTILDEIYANMAVSSCVDEISDIDYCRDMGLID